MSSYLDKKEKFNKVYLITGIILLLISFPVFSAVSKSGDAVVQKVASDHAMYQNVSTGTTLEKELKDKLLIRNELLLKCNKFTSKLSGLFVATFPFLAGVFSILLWFLNLKTIRALKNQ